MPVSVGKVMIDVGLCGAVPRSRCQSRVLSTARRRTSDTFVTLTSAAPTQEKAMHPTLAESRSKNASNRQSSTKAFRPLPQSIRVIEPSSSSEETVMTRRPAPTMLEPPHWAVPAKGEARLEPIGEALGAHGPVNLSHRPYFRVGRSPSSDVQLQHNTSSRRHAMIFHHPNGSCYVVDCGSSHGTFVNGVRVRNASNGSMVVPHRVRRGSLIRFGGPGAPSFVLKSFSVGFSSMVKELDVDENNSCPTHGTRPRDSLLQINTRLNTISGGIEGGILKKRSFDEGDAITSLEPSAKRQRCVSPTLELQPTGEIRIVSPESPRKSRRVTFDEQPENIYPVLVTPDELSSDEDDKTE